MCLVSVQECRGCVLMCDSVTGHLPLSTAIFFPSVHCLPFLISKYIMNLGSAGRQEMKGVTA